LFGIIIKLIDPVFVGKSLIINDSPMIGNIIHYEFHVFFV
jgi:hypothetical protein